MWYKNIAGRFCGLVTKHACDRQTDGQNYDSQDRASIAASRGKNACRELLQGFTRQSAVKSTTSTQTEWTYQSDHDDQRRYETD